MTKRRLIIAVWLLLTASAIVWLLAGNLRTEFGPVVAFLVLASLGYGSARLVALWRLAHNATRPVEPRMLPLRISGAVGGLVTFGPLIAAAAGWIDIIPAAGGFALGMLVLPLAAALFSDGYQGLWLDALVFFARLTPPEDDWILKKR